MDIKAYDAYTNRLKVTGANEDQSRLIVNDLIQQMLDNPDAMPGEPMEQQEMQEPVEPMEQLEMPQEPDKHMQLMEMLQGMNGKMDASSQQATQHGELMQGIHGLTEQLGKPKTLLRDPETGRATGYQNAT